MLCYVMLKHTFNVSCLCLVPTNIPCFFLCNRFGMFIVTRACFHLQRTGLSSVTGGVVPGKANKRIPVQWGVKSIMDPWVLLPHQHLSRNTTKHLKQWWKCCCFLNKDFFSFFFFYHDNQRHVCWPQSFKSFRPISRPPVVEGGTRNSEPARRVNGQLPVNEVLVSFTLQH